MFLAVICFEQSIVIRAIDTDKHASTFSRFSDTINIVITAWIMLAIGAMYVLLGAFCLQSVMERVRKEERENWEEYYELLKEIEAEEDEAEEREWLRENDDTLCFRLQRWWKQWNRRRLRGEGWCGWFGRSLDWRC
jgi:hypothetical protein